MGGGGGGRGGGARGIANHIMGHEINPPSPNIWPSLRLTLKELFLFFLVLALNDPVHLRHLPTERLPLFQQWLPARPGSLLKRHPSASAADDTL